jgi:hypothetical protein
MNQEWERDTAKWVSSEFENSPEGALGFLRDCMYVKCNMKRLKANGTWIKNKALNLWRYRNKIINVSASELKYLAKLKGKPVDPAILKEAKRKHAEAVQMTRLGKIISKN